MASKNPTTEEPTEENTAPPSDANGTNIDPAAGRDVIASGAAAPTHDTGHDAGLSDLDARVPKDAVPLAATTLTVDDPKQPLGSLPDTATTAATVSQPLTIDTGQPSPASDKRLTDAVIPTKPGGANLQDVHDDKTKNIVSEAPKRNYDGLVNQLDLKWAEFKHFASMITGDLDGEMGEVLTLVREHL